MADSRPLGQSDCSWHADFDARMEMLEIMDNATTTNQTHIVLGYPRVRQDNEEGPLRRAQWWCYARNGRLTVRIGNALSDVRYWLWRLCR